MLVADGHRRYARANKISYEESYMKASVVAKDIAKFILVERDIPEFTLFAFSYANIVKRKFRDLSPLLKAYTNFLKEFSNDKEMFENEITVKVYGHTELLPKSCIESIHQIEKSTGRFERKRLNILTAYSGISDLENAIKKTEKEGKKLNFDAVLQNCSIKTPVDLFIRTANQMRISDSPAYLLTYSEMYFIKPYFPALKKTDVDLALIEYKKRNRTFGK
jgi:undecaprenyl diphosphate synthase